MANSYTKLFRAAIGGERFLAVAEVTGDGADTTIAATDVGLERISFAWLQDVDDEADLGISTYAGTSITIDAAITDTEKQLVFCVGY